MLVKKDWRVGRRSQGRSTCNRGLTRSEAVCEQLHRSCNWAAGMGMRIMDFILVVRDYHVLFDPLNFELSHTQKNFRMCRWPVW